MDIMEINRKMGSTRGVECCNQPSFYCPPPLTPVMVLSGFKSPLMPQLWARCAWIMAIALSFTTILGSLPAQAQDASSDSAELEPPITEPLSDDVPAEPAPASEPLPVIPAAPPAPFLVPTEPLPGAGESRLFDPSSSDRIPGIPNARDFETYRLGPGDGIFVSSDFPELSFQAALDIQGNVVVPIEGTVSLNGLTMVESEALITEIYDQYVYYPEVTITLVAQRGVEVTILGEVVRPGFYPLGSPEVTAALLTAGGTTADADLRAVRIQRPLPNGEFLEGTFDLFTPLKVGTALPDIPLQDGDVLFVERLDPGERSDYDAALVSRTTLAQPQIIVRVLNYGSGGALGAITLPNGSRFVDAIIGVNPDLTNVGELALVRFDPEAGEAVTSVLDGGAAFRGDPTQNPPLQHNDVIIMERTLLARITYGLSTFTQPFRDVLGFLLFFDSLSNSATNLFGPGGN